MPNTDVSGFCSSSEWFVIIIFRTSAVRFAPSEYITPFDMIQTELIALTRTDNDKR